MSPFAQLHLICYHLTPNMLLFDSDSCYTTCPQLWLDLSPDPCVLVILYFLYCANLREILILNGTKCHMEQSATPYTVGATS